MKRYKIIDTRTNEIVDVVEWDESDLDALNAQIQHGVALAEMVKGEAVTGRFRVEEAEE